LTVKTIRIRRLYGSGELLSDDMKKHCVTAMLFNVKVHRSKKPSLLQILV
jgi:hypothetical protein